MSHEHWLIRVWDDEESTYLRELNPPEGPLSLWGSRNKATRFDTKDQAEKSLHRVASYCRFEGVRGARAKIVRVTVRT